MPFRYEYRFNLGQQHPELGIRVQFFIDYDTACGVQELANHPHAARREWARHLLRKYRYSGKTTLMAPDYDFTYGQVIRTACPLGATITCLEPNHATQDIILIIQVSFYFLFFIKS